MQIQIAVEEIYVNIASYAYKEKKGSAFSLKAFHQKVLEIGPAPFPVVSKYLLGK